VLEIPRVLVVDVDAAELCDELGRLGLDAQSASDANEALTCLRTDRFDLVLVEMGLTGLSGVGLLRRLARMDCRVPFVGMSAEPNTDDLVQLIRGGAVDFLTKPFKATEVEDTLERIAKTRPRAPSQARSAASSPGVRAPTAPQTHDRAATPSSRPVGTHPRMPYTKAAPSPVQRSQRAAPGRNPVPSRGLRPEPLEARAVHPGQPRILAPSGGPARSSGQAAPPRAPSTQHHADPMKDVLIRLQKGEIELPAIAPIANEIQDLLERPDSAVDDVVKVVTQDPGIVAGVLRLANSGRYGTSKGITDIRQACLRLGNRRVLALAQQLVVGGLYVLSIEPFSTIVTELWRNTLVCARGAQQLGGLLGVEDCEALFIGTMLHNVGELALLRVLSEMPERIPAGAAGLAELGRVLHGAHQEFGAALLKRWRMPPRFVRVASAHHGRPAGPEDRVQKQQRLIAQTAWAMALREGYVYLPGQQPPDLEPLLDGLGLSKDDVISAFTNCRKWVNKDGTLNGTAA
jgi:HD-like signal output (HDOD) protein/ActR/RegA family two-component response regulator